MKRLSFLAAINASGGLQRAISTVAQRNELRPVNIGPGIALFLNDIDRCLHIGEGGAVVGTLFDRRDGDRHVQLLSERDAAFAKSSAGMHFIRSFWGSYLAITSTEKSATVLRDPSGGIACYYARKEGKIIFSSDARMILQTGLIQPAVDMGIVGRALYFPQLPLKETALEGVHHLLPGFAVTFENGESTEHQYWCPWDYIAPSAASKTMVEGLREVVRSTHRAWGRCFKNVVVGLSGGLDSSIVATCLAQSGTAVSCVTAVTADPTGDERTFARAVAEKIGAELLESHHLADAIELDRSVAEAVPFPCGKAHEQAYNNIVRQAVNYFGADALFVGAGGDNVFYLTHSARPLVDRFNMEGWSRGTFTTLHDICSITGASVWQVVFETVRLSRVQKSRADWKTVPDFLTSSFVEREQETPPRHPWLSPNADVPLSKIGHVTMLLRAFNHVEHRDKTMSVPMISSLLSQPIVEYCLGIPPWEACEGGVDRSVARRAFAQDLPIVVTARSGKGSPDGFVGHYIDTHRTEIFERLMDGTLANSGLVDRTQLELALRADAKLRPADCPRLMALLDTEAWIHHWSIFHSEG